MRKSNITLLTLAAAVAVIVAPLSAEAKMQKVHRAHPQATVSSASISPRTAAARAQAQPAAPTPTSSSLAQSLAEGANGAGPKCKPGGKIVMPDGQQHPCQ